MVFEYIMKLKLFKNSVVLIIYNFCCVRKHQIDQGECCCAATRTFVHEKIYDKFVAVATKLAKERKVGNPFEANVQQGKNR